MNKTTRDIEEQYRLTQLAGDVFSDEGSFTIYKAGSAVCEFLEISNWNLRKAVLLISKYGKKAVLEKNKGNKGEKE